MGTFKGKVKAVISLSSIVRNYNRVREKAGRDIIPVVKGDAYGHGLIEVCSALSCAGAKSFAVGTVEEGVILRQAIPGCDILSMLGPIDQSEYGALWDYNILPFVHCFEQLDTLVQASRARPGALPICLKFDTGMHRLGFTLADIPAIAAKLRCAPALELVLASSHFSNADDPSDLGYLNMQLSEFMQIRSALKSQGFTFRSTLSNSAAALAYPEIGIGTHRIGIVLYGVNPLHGTGKSSLCDWPEPAMSVKSVVIARHELKKGQKISYGCTFEADRDMSAAIVAVGYADGYSRTLSNRGFMCVHGKRARIIGRVCLQMAAIDVSDIPQCRVGSEAYLLGGDGAGRVSIYELSDWWGSIPAEVMNALSGNKREYVLV